MMTPLPHQVAGAEFLAARNYGLLADAPRVGKTGAAILAADKAGYRRILNITTASGRPVWTRAWAQWSDAGRSVETHYTGEWSDKYRRADVAIVSWSQLARVSDVSWDLIIADESHYAKSPTAQRTQALYGAFHGRDRGIGRCDMAGAVWCLTGTPIPNAPNDLWPMLRALAPERIEGFLRYDDFLHHFCIVRKKAISRWNKIDVVVGGRNMDELRERLDGFWLRRTQQDVGITKPLYDVLPIHIGPALRREIEAAVPEAEDVLAAAETGETRSLDMHLGTLRRITGLPKAAGVAATVMDEMESGVDKVVLMCWHRDVADDLAKRLSKFGVVTVTGSTSPKHRDEAVQKFQAGQARVFVGQIIACGEAIDLSAAAELIFVESSFTPKDMAQAALRITNVNQGRQPRVRVAALEGSIDEALQAVLVRKVATNKEVIS